MRKYIKSIERHIKTFTKFYIPFIVFIFICIACNKLPPLKEAFKDDFTIGAALSSNQILGKDSVGMATVVKQFNTISPENAMKWENIHPRPCVYNFDTVDRYVEFGEKNHMFTIGHTLVWHSQVPKWVFEDGSGNPVGRDTLLKRMHDHIFTILSRYKGRISGYDVVNEAIADDGQLRKSKWLQIIGDDFIQKAFEYAHEADPQAALYYNDYNIEQASKRKPVLLKLIQDLKSKGIKISGVGIQGHWHLDIPRISEVDSAIQDFSSLGVKIMFTELDINVLPQPNRMTGADVSKKAAYQKQYNPYPESLPDSMQEKLANRYADFFKVFVKNKGKVQRVTFWGVDDNQSWLNNWPIRGRTNYPLLFDRKCQPKPAFYSVVKVGLGI
jgi:endo-1,4-beta-xylanase